MSWWVSLEKVGKCVNVPCFSAGGTYAIGGDTRADLNITYNYSVHYGGVGEKGLWSLDGMLAKDAIPILECVVQALGTVQDNDYWKSTPGNAGYALNVLLGWAHLRPDAVFCVR